MDRQKFMQECKALMLPEDYEENEYILEHMQDCEQFIDLLRMGAELDAKYNVLTETETSI